MSARLANRPMKSNYFLQNEHGQKRSIDEEYREESQQLRFPSKLEEANTYQNLYNKAKKEILRKY